MKPNAQKGVIPDDFMAVIRSFMESRIILSAVELDIFSAIDKGADSKEIASRLKTDHRATEMFLNALVSMHLLIKENNKFYNSSLATDYLTDKSPYNSRMSLKHFANLWSKWSNLTDCIRNGGSVDYKERDDRDTEWTESFIAAMHHNGLQRATEVIEKLDASSVSNLLDIGGGSGVYSITFARDNPNLKATVLDLPSVVPLTRRYIDDAGLNLRINVRAGDFHKDKFGNGFDLVFLSAICHMNNIEENKRLLEKSFSALKSGGRVVIQDFILDEDRTKPKIAAIFALNMLVATLEGGTYTESEYFDWLKGAGFVNPKHERLSGTTGLIIGYKP